MEYFKKIKLKQLKVFQTIDDRDRNSSVDIFRGIAILSVVFFHYSYLPYGYLGVDLFFVISGLLVGRVLIKSFSNNEKISFFKFILTRGFKIWPSYYFFIFSGALISYILYRDLNPKQVLLLNNLPKYLFFYLNYKGGSYYAHHMWSICVEEHFYILLPILFILIQRVTNNKKYLFISMGLMAIGGISSKIIGYCINFETYTATHNRIDQLALGVILSLLIFYNKDKVEKF